MRIPAEKNGYGHWMRERSAARFSADDAGNPAARQKTAKCPGIPRKETGINGPGSLCSRIK